ncbi:MAG TPA: chromate efflux transporter [Solirubrobacterales bacterium]|nr:chromate efflux transporter [Solirubrobacterales bacterium]
MLTIAREWGRIGVVGFGGPPAHIALLRELTVERRRWISAHRFEDAIAACNLLPGPASTQLSIFCAWTLRGAPGALVGGAAFILPGLIAILGLSVLFLSSPPDWIKGAGGGAGAAVAAVALHAGSTLIGPSRERAASLARWAAYVAAGFIASATVGPWVVLVLVGSGLVELGFQRRTRPALGQHAWPLLVALVAAISGGVGALVWVAFKVGALSYGGGFVIVPLMQRDAVDTYQWMTDAEFLNAVALGQVTPGPITHTVAVVGWAAGGTGGALLAAAVAFAPSFLLVLAGARHFEALRANRDAQAFLGGAGPAAIGAILGASISLALALTEGWQWGVLAGATVALLVLRLGVVTTLLGAAAVGTAAVLLGASVP